MEMKVGRYLVETMTTPSEVKEMEILEVSSDKKYLKISFSSNDSSWILASEIKHKIIEELPKIVRVDSASKITDSSDYSTCEYPHCSSSPSYRIGTDSYVQDHYCKKCRWFYDMSDSPINSECAHPGNVGEDNVPKKWPSEIVSQETGCSWFERETPWDGIKGFFGFPPWNPKGKYFFENGSWVLWFAGAVTFLAILLCSIFKCK